MRPNVSKFKIYEESARDAKYWANMADENVLLNTMYAGKPWADLTDPVMQYISTATGPLSGKRTPLSDFLQGSGRVEKTDSDYVRWRLKGTGELNAVQIENLNEGITTPGIQGTEIPWKSDVEWFGEGDIIAPVVAKDFQLVIQADPIADGSGFIYSTQLVDANLNSYFPPELLEAGLQWIKIGSAYGEASSKYGTFSMGGMSYIEFEVDMTDSGKELKVTNKAQETVLRVKSLDAKGLPLEDMPDQIITKLEAEFVASSKWEKELSLFYGRSMGRHVIDSSSGFHRRKGPGLLEFMEDGNVLPYPVQGGSLEMFEEFFQSIWFDRVNYNNRNVVMYTGQGGLQLWNQWVTKRYADSSVPSDFNTFTGGAKSYDPANYKGLSFQNAFFTETKIFPFGSIRVEHWPILDNMWLNGGALHPKTGIPMSSYEFIVLDYGLGSGSGNNISLMQRSNTQEVYTYLCGTWSPAGPIKKGSAFTTTHPGRYYQLLWADTYGLRVKDITLTAWFRPSVTY
jgi:hypothetical protein